MNERTDGRTTLLLRIIGLDCLSDVQPFTRERTKNVLNISQKNVAVRRIKVVLQPLPLFINRKIRWPNGRGGGKILCDIFDRRSLHSYSGDLGGSEDVLLDGHETNCSFRFTGYLFFFVFRQLLTRAKFAHRSSS